MERWGAARRASALEEQHHGGLEEGPGISLRDTERNTMATPAIIGITRPQGGWDGSYVHYDGDPASLGPKLLNLAVDYEGDLGAVWRFIARATWGYRHAFVDPYEAGEIVAWLGTGRGAEPLLRDTDAFVRTNAAFWYIFDLKERTLSLFQPHHEAGECVWSMSERIHFNERGIPRFSLPPSDALDWRNRLGDYGSDDPAVTAMELIRILDEALPVRGPWMWLGPCHEALELWNEGSSFELPRPSLVAEGLLYPLTLLVPRQRVGGGWEKRPSIAEIVEEPSLILVPRRVLGDFRRCELGLRAALAAILEAASGGKLPLCRSPDVFSSVFFPLGYLDLALENASLYAALRNHILAMIGELEP